jgi:molybdopterin guanine dinucleotide-containing S/N-oxide reductase-like protein
MEENENGNGAKKLSRREFIKTAGLFVGGAAVGAAATYVVSPNAAPTTGTTTTEVTGGVPEVKEVIKEVPVTVTGIVPPALEPETTKVVQIQHLIAFDVKNGRIVRGRRVHFDEDFPELKPWTITARGQTWTAPVKSPPPAYYLSHRKRKDSPNRIRYPLKRVDWEPGGDPNKINAQNRGISNYVRISWDEAATIIASEMKRVADKYGTSALGAMYGGGHSEGHNVPGTHEIQETFMQWWAMKEYGSPISIQESPATSSSGGQLGGRYVLGSDYESVDVLKDVAEHAENLLIWSGDVVSKAWRYPIGMVQGMWYHWFGELGIKRITFSPNLNTGAGLLSDKWIPVNPRTDVPLMLAIAYTWITENTFDQDYLDTHTVGFDLFKSYVMGTDGDNTPKTPEWASAICGVPEWTIKALARTWAAKPTSIAFGRSGGGANGRTLYADNANRIQLYLLAMQGLGKPGQHQMYYLQSAIGGAAQSPSVGSVGGNSKMAAAMADDGVELPDDAEMQAFPRGYFGKALLDPPVEYYPVGDQFRKITYPMPGKSPVHMIWGTSASYTGSMQWGFGTQKGMQSPTLECIVHQCMWLEDAISFSDIILPIMVAEESPEINSTVDIYNSLTLRTEPLVAPIGEAKTDLGAVIEVANKLGWADKITGGKSYDELIQDRLKEGYENSGVTDLVSWEKLLDKGYFPQVPDPKWYDREPKMKAFYDDPANNPLKTPSGLLEFESGLLKENFPDDKERPPVARWVTGGPASEGWTHDEDPFGERAKTYPLTIVSDTSTWKHHSMFSDVPWTREIEKVIGWDGYAYSPVWINAKDAEPRGIKDGDIVKVFNDRGGVLGGAVISERIVPGALRFEKAGGGHHIIPGELHHGGNTNCINPKDCFSRNVYGLAATHFLVQVEKVTGDQMDEWRAKYPEHFERDYDPAYGPFFSGWVDENKGAEL